MNPCSTPKPGRNPGTYDVVPHEDLKVSYVRPCVAGRVFAIAFHPSYISNYPFTSLLLQLILSIPAVAASLGLACSPQHTATNPDSPISPLLTSPCPTQTPTKTPATAAALNHAVAVAKTNGRNNPTTPRHNQWPQCASNPPPKNSTTPPPPAQQKCNPSNASPHPPNP